MERAHEPLRMVRVCWFMIITKKFNIDITPKWIVYSLVWRVSLQKVCRMRGCRVWILFKDTSSIISRVFIYLIIQSLVSSLFPNLVLNDITFDFISGRVRDFWEDDSSSSRICYIYFSSARSMNFRFDDSRTSSFILNIYFSASMSDLL